MSKYTPSTSDKQPKGSFKSEISMLEESLDKTVESKTKSPKPPRSLKLNIDEDKPEADLP